MKLPDLSKLKPTPKGEATGRARTQLKVPGPVEDIYRDMRDRRLLLPALALIIAIIAVPVALSVSKSDPPEPIAFVPPEGAEAVSPAVLAEGPIGVRDYRERLDELKSKNPFESSSQMSPQDVSEATALAEPASSGATPAPTPTPAPPAPTSSPAPAPSPSAPSAPSEPAPSAPPASEPAPEPKVKKEIVVMAPRLDVSAGPAGQTRKMRNAKIGDLLPTKRVAPIAMFIGISGNLNYAHFAIADGVSVSSGQGLCSPGPRNCQFLKLAVGKKRVFLYGPHERRYSIKITDIREVVAERRKAG